MSEKDESRSQQIARYANSPVALSYLQKIIDRSDPDRFHFTDLDDADELVSVYGDTPLEDTIYFLNENSRIPTKKPVTVAAVKPDVDSPDLILEPDLVLDLCSVKLQSHVEAEAIASGKGVFSDVDAGKDQLIIGKVMGVTAGHVVVSLGRSATIIPLSDLDFVPAKGDDATISFRGGKGMAVNLRGSEIEGGR
jgi:hypothetical protein